MKQWSYYEGAKQDSAYNIELELRISFHTVSIAITVFTLWLQNKFLKEYRYCTGLVQVNIIIVVGIK